jgi:Zn-dependent protease/predicted transcriptional regulator
LKSHIRLGRIAGVELGLHYSWIVIAVLITLSLVTRFRYTNPDWSTATVWVSAVITGLLFFVGLFTHELSHAMVAKSRGLPIHGITLFFLGGMAQIEREPEDAGTEFWMAIAGPFASIVLGCLCFAVAHVVFGWQMAQAPRAPGAAVLVWLGYINLALALFNLIPGFPMDGGRVLRAVIWWMTGDGRKATRVAARVGQGVGWLFIAWGVFRIFTGEGIGALWIALIGWFLVQAASATVYQMQAVSLLREFRVRDIVSRDCTRVDAGSSVQDFVDWLLTRGEGRCFLAFEGGRLAGVVTLSDIRKVDRALWPQTPLRAVMRPVDAVPMVTPETPASDALQKMARDDADQLLVVRDGYVEGTVTRDRIQQLLQFRSELRAA